MMSVIHFMIVTFRIVLIAMLLMVSTGGLAETVIRPGLWEITTRSDLLGLVQHIPSKQLRQMDLLAKQYGLKIPHIKNGAATSRVCITSEMVQQDIPLQFYEAQSGCSAINIQREDNRYTIDLQCDNSQFKGKGRVVGIFSTPESFTSSTEFNSIVQGAPINVSANTTGHWIDEQCEIASPES